MDLEEDMPSEILTSDPETPMTSEGEVSVGSNHASSDSGSLTQRAAMIRDELLGNDSHSHSSEHGSGSSSGDSDIVIQEIVQTEPREDRDDELDQRLSTSSIAHSLRHIALSFDEKSRELESLRAIQQTHDEHCAKLRSQLAAKETEKQAMSDELDDTLASLSALQRGVEALRLDVQHKDELLCFSDRISCRLFDLIHAIRAQVEAAESLSPAIRSLSSNPSLTPTQSEASHLTSSNETAATSTSADNSHVNSEGPVSAEELVKQIQAKYSGGSSL